MKDSVKAFVFDMDGVLLDTESMCERVWSLCGGEFGIGRDASVALQNECLGMSTAHQAEVLKERFGCDFPAESFLKCFSEIFYELETNEGIALKPFTRECLAHLKAQGYLLSLASSTEEATVRRQMANADLLDFFDSITCGDNVAHSKPDPEIYLKSAEGISCTPAFCAAVEDSPNGILSAKSAGLITIMVPDRIRPDGTLLAKVDFLYDSLKGVIDNF